MSERGGGDQQSHRLLVPRFAQESDEAEWWFNSQYEHDRVMAEAVQDGQGISLLSILQEHGIPGPGVPVEIPAEDVTRAQAEAERIGVRYEDYIRKLVHEALLREQKP